MNKSYRLKNGNYIDTRGIVNNKVILSDLLRNMSKNPIGEFVLWEGNRLITCDNTYQYIGTFYNINVNLEIKFPIKEEFKRKYKLALEYTDNKTNGNVYIRFSKTDGTNIQERLFLNTWGTVGDGTKHFGCLEAPDFSVYENHIDMFCTPDFATGGQVRIYKLYLLVYDELEV